MILLDRNNQEVEVISQFLIPNHTNTVYNIEVDDFHTYHVGRLGVWVHNADCCEANQIIEKTKHYHQLKLLHQAELMENSTKLAWYYGYQIQIESDYIPKAWLEMTPLKNYQDEFSFMNKYSIK